MADSPPPDPPSPFVFEWIATLEPSLPRPRRGLDVAMGSGRHARELARAGLNVFGVDRRLDAVRDAMRRVHTGGASLRGWCADLTAHPLPANYFALVVVARYLQRDLFPALRGALVPGGVLICETFTVAQRALGRGPTSPEHLLEPGELLAHAAGLEVLFYEEVRAPDALARLVARRAAPAVSGAHRHPAEVR